MRIPRTCTATAAPLFLFAICIIGCKTTAPTPPVDTAPTVAISSPSSGAVIFGVDTIVVSASDDRGVTYVQVFLDNQLAVTDSTSPYVIIWNTEQSSDGTHSLQAKAYDTQGHSTSSAPVSVTLRNAPPTTSITSPVSGEICSGTDTIFVTANGANTLTKVELYLNGTLAATDNASPWRFIWNTTQWNDGSYNIQAVSYDVANHYGLSSTVTAIVCNNPPSTSITSPSAGATVSGTTTVQVSATSAITVSKVELYVDGSLLSTDNSSPWSFSWNTQQVSDGSHSLQAKAYDALGHVGTSSSVSVTVANTQFPATFINTVFTPISITVQSVTRTIQPGDSTTYYFNSNPQSLSFSASTSGKTTSNTTVGLVVTWSGPLTVSGYSSIRVNLQLSTSYFFMYLSNTGATLSPLYVNYGLSDQTVDYISIPGDGVKYSIGYYKAHSGGVVRGYKYPSLSSYIYWTLSFSFVVNQSQWLTNSLFKRGDSSTDLQVYAGEAVPSSPSSTGQANRHEPGSNTMYVFPHE
ncbi:MAG TPA: Ig-like domain-containing protein [Bacteroidota bacterium]|nr:Ig-like domain-containing protein [Bacteroidota bacterium]